MVKLELDSMIFTLMGSQGMLLFRHHYLHCIIYQKLQEPSNFEFNYPYSFGVEHAEEPSCRRGDV